MAGWLDQLKGHVNHVGVSAALEGLDAGPGAPLVGRSKHSDPVQYEGAAKTDRVSGFVGPYLERHGVVPVNTFAWDEVQGRRTVSSSSASQGGREAVHRDDFTPADPTLAHKLAEAKKLPGLEKSEDINVLLNRPVTHLTPEVHDKLDAHYGKDKWIVKTYGDEAYGGQGIYFPQRARQMHKDAQDTLWAAGGELGKHGFQHHRDEHGTIVGIRHASGDTYLFGTKKYEQTIDGDVRHWGDRSAAAAPHERGAALDFGGKEYMAQPAFNVVGVTEADRAAGVTIAKGEGRVHVVTRDGRAEVVPHATWMKGDHLPVVFETHETRAMAKAAADAINALPESERRGQIYAPDVIKTDQGYRVIEANPANHTGSSGYLGDNPMVIDAYVSHLTNRVPAHVAFVRKLLETRRGLDPAANMSYAQARDELGRFARSGRVRLRRAVRAAGATRVGKVARAVEHALGIVAHKTRDVAEEAARVRGFSEQQTARLKRTLMAADFVGGYVTGGAAAATLGPLAGKAAMFAPSASAVYLAYSTARNPAATMTAARKVLRDTIHGKPARAGGGAK